MQLSYRIIKNKNIDLTEETVTLTEPKLEQYIPEEDEFDIDKSFFSSLDIDRFKAHIKSRLEEENERERQILIEKARLELHVEAEKIKNESLEKGYKEGLEKGRKEGLVRGYNEGLEKCKEECLELKENALKLLQDAQMEVKDYYKDTRDELINLAGQMAESIVHNTIDTSDENIMLLIKPIIQMYEKSERIIITIHPGNIPYLKSRLEEMEATSPGTRFIILEDNNLEKNGCILENDNQIIDLQIKKQISSIIRDINSLEV